MSTTPDITARIGTITAPRSTARFIARNKLTGHYNSGKGFLAESPDDAVVFAECERNYYEHVWPESIEWIPLNHSTDAAYDAFTGQVTLTRKYFGPLVGPTIKTIHTERHTFKLDTLWNVAEHNPSITIQ